MPPSLTPNFFPSGIPCPTPAFRRAASGPSAALGPGFAAGQPAGSAPSPTWKEPPGPAAGLRRRLLPSGAQGARGGQVGEEHRFENKAYSEIPRCWKRGRQQIVLEPFEFSELYSITDGMP